MTWTCTINSKINGTHLKAFYLRISKLHSIEMGKYFKTFGGTIYFAVDGTQLPYFTKYLVILHSYPIVISILLVSNKLKAVIESLTMGLKLRINPKQRWVQIIKI